jgi:glutathione S-transferase
MPAVLTINSRNFGAWSMRSWLLCRLAGLDFEERVVEASDPASRAELLQLSPSFLVPSLECDGVKMWDTLAIAEYLHEVRPDAGLLPSDPAQRAHCRSICGELHSGFQNLRSAMPMNIKRWYPDFKVWSGVEPDIERVLAIWRECLQGYGGPWLFGAKVTAADALYAPECTRFQTYSVPLEPDVEAYVATVLACPEVTEWVGLAQAEPNELLELEGEF